MSELQTVRGYEGQASTTGAGYGLYWYEGDYQYDIGGFLGLEDTLAIADSLEVVSIDIWQERLTGSMQE